jgi:ferredoxin-NADP reductase
VTTDVSAGTPLRWKEAVIERVVHQTPRVTSVFLRSALGPYQAGQPSMSA